MRPVPLLDFLDEFTQRWPTIFANPPKLQLGIRPPIEIVAMVRVRVFRVMLGVVVSKNISKGADGCVVSVKNRLHVCVDAIALGDLKGLFDFDDDVSEAGDFSRNEDLAAAGNNRQRIFSDEASLPEGGHPPIVRIEVGADPSRAVSCAGQSDLVGEVP